MNSSYLLSALLGLFLIASCTSHHKHAHVHEVNPRIPTENSFPNSQLITEEKLIEAAQSLLNYTDANYPEGWKELHFYQTNDFQDFLAIREFNTGPRYRYSSAPNLDISEKYRAWSEAPVTQQNTPYAFINPEERSYIQEQVSQTIQSGSEKIKEIFNLLSMEYKSITGKDLSEQNAKELLQEILYKDFDRILASLRNLRARIIRYQAGILEISKHKTDAYPQKSFKYFQMLKNQAFLKDYVQKNARYLDLKKHPQWAFGTALDGALLSLRNSSAKLNFFRNALASL